MFLFFYDIYNLINILLLLYYYGCGHWHIFNLYVCRHFFHQSAFCPIRRFVPFGVFSIRCFLLYYSTFCPTRRFFHSTFCPIRHFSIRHFVPFGHFVFWHFVVRRFLLLALVPSTFCRWTDFSCCRSAITGRYSTCLSNCLSALCLPTILTVSVGLSLSISLSVCHSRPISIYLSVCLFARLSF